MIWNDDDVAEGNEGRPPSEQHSGPPQIDDGGNGCGERPSGRGRQPQPQPNSQSPEGPFGRPGGGRHGTKKGSS